MSTSFQGILRISSASPSGITAVGLRGRFNERGEFLVTTIPSVDEDGAATTQEAVFPHLVDGGGYQTQFILLSGLAGQATNGIIRFFRQTGQELVLPLK